MSLLNTLSLRRISFEASEKSVRGNLSATSLQVSPESFDNLCKQMSEAYGMYADLYPHGSRKLVSSQYVVKSEFVKPLA